jgi:hypothetical protein
VSTSHRSYTTTATNIGGGSTSLHSFAAAEEERDRLFLEAMIGAGIPDWFAKSRVEDLYDY